MLTDQVYYYIDCQLKIRKVALILLALSSINTCNYYTALIVNILYYLSQLRVRVCI